MPRREYEDPQYERYEGRDDQSWRDQSNRGSRDWDRRSDDFRSEGRENYGGRRDPEFRRYESDFRYEPDFRRYEPDYRAGRAGEQRYGGSSPYWNDDRREPQRYGSRDWNRSPYGQQSGPYGQPQHGGYAQDWNRQSYSQQGDSWQTIGRERSQQWRPTSEFGGYHYDRPDYSRQQSNYGARDQYEPYDRQRESRGREEGWTDQLRHTGHQFAARVKRAFRGPKGYKRSDERIREDVSERLAQADELDPSDIEVKVQNAEVTLTGTVRSRHEKFLAEEIADEVLGVNDVHVLLRVRRDQEQNTGAGTSTTGNQDPSRNARA